MFTGISVILQLLLGGVFLSKINAKQQQLSLTYRHVLQCPVPLCMALRGKYYLLHEEHANCVVRASDTPGLSRVINSLLTYLY